MADETDEVLVLDEEQVIEDVEGDEPDIDGTEEQEDGEPEETVFGFDGEEEGPAPDPESESSVIRELRAKYREAAAELKQLKTASQPEQIEVGEKPTLESCEYDEERFETELDDWKARKAKADSAAQKREEEREKQEKQWGEIHRAYEADKASLNIPNFEDAEAEVAAVLPEHTRALLLKSGKGAALVAALNRSPTTLEELSKLDPTDAAMMIGELRSKLKMTTRSRPSPDRPVRGNAASTSADKELARLEKEAERTGNRSKVIAYKRELRKQA